MSKHTFMLDDTHIAWIESVISKDIESISIVGIKATEGDAQAKTLAESTVKAMASLGGGECKLLKLSRVGETIMIIEEN